MNADSRFGCSNCGLLRHDASIAGSAAQSGWTSSPAEEQITPPIEDTEPVPTAGDAAESPVEPRTVADWIPFDGDDNAAASTGVPLWRRIPIGWVLFAVLIGGGAIAGWYFNASRSSSGEITKSGDLTAADLRVGDCFDLKDPGADEIDEVKAGPCTSAHEFEMFFVASMPEGDFPTDAAFETYVTDNCYPAFGAYIGKEYGQSELEMYWLAPTASGWRGGDRSVQCAAYHPRVHTQTVSLKSSNR